MPRLLGAAVALQVAAAAFGWGAEVHRTITRLALEELGPPAPAWLREPAAVAGAAFHSNQPDRWRGWEALPLKHANDPEHYLDADRLESFGLALATVPPLRREYLKALVLAKERAPDRVEPYDPERDPARTHEWPGFVLHAVAEEYARLQAALHQVRILESLDDPLREVQLAQARALALVHLGGLSHYVADIAQPLHTTRHYDGWRGPNPAGYRWRDRFHAYIDEGFCAAHGIRANDLRPHIRRSVRVSAADPWDDVRAYFERSHARVPELYALESDGRLDGPEGVALVTSQLGDAVGMLAALLRAACESSQPTPEQIAGWLRYDGADAGHPAPATRPATQPAGAGS